MIINNGLGDNGNDDLINSNIKIMNSFNENNLPNLDVCVLAALELFSSIEIPNVSIPYKRPLVVGSGNAIASGKIIFAKTDAIFADESSVYEKLENISAIDGVVLLSASGAKHAPIIAKLAKEKNKKVTLLTNTKNSEAEKYADKTYVFLKNREPYTYNTSTYMGMILGHTKEDPKKILHFIKNEIDSITLPDFSKIDKYFLIIPEEFYGVIRLLNVKFIELFGRKVSRDIETFEYITHASTVVPSNELFITFGKEGSEKQQSLMGKNRLHIPLPKNADYATMMAIGYYLVGKIQSCQPDYFKQNIGAYMKKASEVFEKEMKVIVE
jgi:hypothetical protein